MSHIGSSYRARGVFSPTQMLSRCVMMPMLVFHLLVNDKSAAALPNALRGKREVRSWLDEDFPPGLPVEVHSLGDLSPGDEPWYLEGRRSHAGPAPVLSQREEPLTPRHDPHHNNNNNNNNRKSGDKRRKVAPMDSIGSSSMSGHRNRKDEPTNHWEE